MQNLVNSLPHYLQMESFLAYAAVFVGGVLISFTPCVYPVIPITVGYIGSRSQGSRWRGLVLSLAYVVGMAATYSALGGAAALTGRAFGEAAASPISYLIVGTLCILLALSLFDLFRLPLPTFRAGATRWPDGVIGALGVGMASGLIVGPCTAPVLGALLLYVGARRNLLVGTSLLFVFALGMGALLVLLGTFSGILAGLPKSGRWLLFVKRGFGVLMVLAGGYFLLEAGRRAERSVPMHGAETMDFTLESVGGERVSLRDAAGGKPVLLVFWATWCPHCNGAVPEINRIQARLSNRLRILAIDYMEPRRKVKAFVESKNVTYPVLLDSDGRVARKYRVLGIPTYILIDRNGRVAYSDNALPPSIDSYL